MSTVDLWHPHEHTYIYVLNICEIWYIVYDIIIYNACLLMKARLDVLNPSTREAWAMVKQLITPLQVGPAAQRPYLPPCLTWTALLWHMVEISLDYTVVLGWPELCKAICKKKVRHILTPVSSPSQTRHKHKSCSKPTTKTSHWLDTFSFLPSRLLQNAQGDFAWQQSLYTPHPILFLVGHVEVWYWL